MTFSKRLRFYLIGFVLGVFVSIFFFRGRGCAWLPENRVLQRLSQSYILADDSMRCVLKCNHIDSINIKNLFKTGNVLFNESRPNDMPKMYVIKGKINNLKEFKISFLLADSLATINFFFNSDSKCNYCILPASKAYLYALPDKN